MSIAETADFGTVLKRLREARGLSQEALAERAAVSAKAVGALETGLRKAPYPKTVALLADALDLDPALRAQLVDAAAAARAARDAREPHDGNVPASLGPVIGRSREVADLTAGLASSRLVTVLGPGGIGKTTLALEAARTNSTRFADGAYFCDLSSLVDGAMIGAAIAGARGVRLRTDTDPAAALALALRSSEMLLVLDNCEHVVEDASAVASVLLKTCPKLTILATSRRSLAIPAEVTFRPPPLATPLLDEDEQLSAVDARTFSAIALFAERGRAVNPSFALTDDNAPLVARICRRLDGIALAIELAAAQLRAMTVTDIARHLDRRFRLLRDGRYADAPRQRTLAAAFDWSYTLLAEQERSFFRALGTFAGAFTLDAALEICCEPEADELRALELLAALVDASLVVVDAADASTRYRLLETTRAYALEKVAEHGEGPWLSARHLEYYRRHGAEIDLAEHLEDVRAALTFALSGGDVAGGAELATTIGVQWEKLGLAGEGASRFSAFIGSVDDGRPDLIARLWAALSFLQGNALRFPESLAAARKAVEVARGAGDPTILFNALRALSVFAAWSGEYDEARSALDEASALADAQPSTLRALHVLAARGHLARMSGDFAAAVAAFEDARLVAQTLGDDYREISAAVHISEIEHERGNTVRAATLMRELAVRSLSTVDAQVVLGNLVGYLVALDDVAGSRAVAKQFFALPVHGALSTFATAALEHLALADALSGAFERAAQLSGYCEEWYRASGQQRQFTERHSHERIAALLERNLPSQTYAALTNEGAELTAKRATRIALEG